MVFPIYEYSRDNHDYIYLIEDTERNGIYDKVHKFFSLVTSPTIRNNTMISCSTDAEKGSLMKKQQKIFCL